MNVDPNQNGNVQVNSKAVEAKLRSKKECFVFLNIDCKAYLPDDPDCVTTYFCKQLISGEKKRKYIVSINRVHRHKEGTAPGDLLPTIRRNLCQRYA